MALDRDNTAKPMLSAADGSPSPKQHRRLRHMATAGMFLAVAVGLAACGGDAPTILNTEKVERAIEQSSLLQRGKRVHVSCPSGVHQRKGLKFTCTAIGRGIRANFVVTELDDAGRVHYAAR